ncbi:hypothetical protein [Pseudoxanthomonas sp. UTMC 1351]|uniref:hypothetical protein n=1 Tax=Pseudoxanthomonas sp. UTMC 1351 TaxID=2695853 RepID=UPI0034CF066C
MDDAKHIERLYDALKDEFKLYVDSLLKIVGFQLLGLGWLLTSEGAKTALAHRGLHQSTQLGLWLLAANVVLLILAHYFRSRRLKKVLNTLVPDQAVVIENYMIQPFQVFINALAIGGLFWLLFSSLPAVK